MYLNLDSILQMKEPVTIEKVLRNSTASLGLSGGGDFSLQRRLQPATGGHRLKPMLQAEARATGGI
jgi:hypothetical protein